MAIKDKNIQKVPPTPSDNSPQTLPAWKKASLGQLSLRELTEQALLQQVAPIGALVNGRGDILYLHGRTGMYLEPAPEETAVNNILEMARNGLQRELASALHKTSTSQKVSHRNGLRVKSHGAFITVNLTISPMITGPATSAEMPLYLVVLEEVVPMGDDSSSDTAGSVPSAELDASVYIASLKQELRTKEELLQNAFDEIRTLHGFVPICANCKQIRVDKDFWSQVEVYVRDHTEVQFSHCFCPECAKRLHPEVYLEPGGPDDPPK